MRFMGAANGDFRLMPKGKGSPRPRVATDEPLRRGRDDERPKRKKPDVAEELVLAARRAARESEIFPGIPLS